MKFSELLKESMTDNAKISMNENGFYINVLKDFFMFCADGKEFLKYTERKLHNILK